MQRLDLILWVDDKVPGDTFDVFANISAAGLPLDAIDTDQAISGDEPAPFHTLSRGGAGHGDAGRYQVSPSPWTASGDAARGGGRRGGDAIPGPGCT